MKFFSRGACVAILAITAVACGPSHPPVLPISGMVTLDGQPVESGKLTFETPGQRPATGVIRNGEIVEMTTFEFNDGAPPGNHSVAVFVVKENYNYVAPDNPGAASGSASMQVTSLIPKRYNDPATSDLTADVTYDGENHFEFALSSKK